MKKVGVVICNFNKKDYVLKCIDSILGQTMKDFDIYVADNASIDGSVQAIEEAYGDKVCLVKNIENLGGSGGFNSGMRKALKTEYEYLLLMDNDAYLKEDALEIMCNTSDQDQTIGMQGCKIMILDEPDRIQDCGSFIDYDHISVHIPHQLEKDEEANLTALVECDYVPACAMLVRVDAIKKIGLMPEKNFIYWDDMEWGIQFNRAGYKVVANPKAIAWHKSGQKGNQNTFAKYYWLRNKTKFFTKYMQTKKNEGVVSEEFIKNRMDMIMREIFQGVYACYFQGKVNRAKTMMDAFVDAVSDVTGKAADYKIRGYVEVVDRMEAFVNGLHPDDVVLLEMKDYKNNTERIIKRIRGINQKYSNQTKIRVIGKCSNQENIILGIPVENITVDEIRSESKENIKIMHVCDHVFSLNGQECEDIIIDGYCNLIFNERDYEYCRSFEENYKLFKLSYEDRLYDMIKQYN